MVEFLDDELEELQKKIAARSGFTLMGHHMLLYGLCEDCRAKRHDND